MSTEGGGASNSVPLLTECLQSAPSCHPSNGCCAAADQAHMVPLYELIYSCALSITSQLSMNSKSAFYMRLGAY